MASPLAQDAKDHFAQLAVQYYVAGRSAAINKMIPVLGNLLHHAVEMSLKAALAPSLTMRDIKGLSHNLPKIWDQFKAYFPNVKSSSFDAAVAALHKFEELRYPDSIMARGARMEFVLFREHVDPDRSQETGIPSYLLVLEDIDALQELIFEAANINPRVFCGSMTEQAKQHLLLHNRHASKW